MYFGVMFRSVMLRFVLPVAFASCVVAYFGLPYIERLLAEWFRSDVELRAQLVMRSMEEPITELVEKGTEWRLRAYLAKITADERLLAVLVCRTDGSTLFKTDRAPPAISCDAASMPNSTPTRIVQLPSGSVQISRFDFDAAEPTPFRVLMLHDLSFVDRRQRTARDFVLVFVGISVLLLALLVVLVAWLQLRRWAEILIGDIRGKRFRDDAKSPRSSMPILSQVRKVLAEAEAQQRLEIDFRENWTPQALRQVVRDHLHSAQVIIVSNREPYIHNFDAEHRPVMQVPASGMVTALEPIMRACSGVWVAHGAGSADRETVDRYDQIQVPPGDPAYTLRRVWLTEAQEQGYYYGFSNEGIWPLCHLAYVRPAFRAGDWHAYEEVNAKFAEVVAAESNTDSPVILIQDFHFALLPQLIRKKIPKATIALFWHIPWPNAETFGVCPWKREILLHMLSADILGFHTRYHCQNFLDAVDRFVECQIDHEHMTVTLQGHVCLVAPYPISIEWPPRWLQRLPDIAGVPRGGTRAIPDRPRGVHRARCGTLGFHQGNHRALSRVGGAAGQKPSAPGAHLPAAGGRSVAGSIAGVPGAAAAYLQRSGTHQHQICGRRLAPHRAHRRTSGAARACSSCTGRPISAWSTACTTA